LHLSNEFLMKQPQDAEALILRGQIQIQQKKFDEAATTMQKALKDSPDNATGRYQLGLGLQEKGDAGQAESQWREAVRLRPNLGEAWRALAVVATRRGDWNALESIGDQLKKIAPTAAEGYLFRATARFIKGDANSAEADLKHVVELAPQSALGYVHLGHLRAAQKRRSESETLFRQALKKEPGSIEAVQGLVDLDFRRDRATDAVHLLQAQLKSAQPGEAERALVRAAEIDKQNANPLILLASVQASRGETDQAIGSYQ
jgi:Tfp pilus assembly protein PilF